MDDHAPRADELQSVYIEHMHVLAAHTDDMRASMAADALM